MARRASPTYRRPAKNCLLCWEHTPVFRLYYVTCLAKPSLSSGETYHREATDFVFGVPRRAKTKNGPVSIRDLHNLTRPDNTDNQAPLRYAGHRVRLVGPGIRFDGTRCGQDVIRSRKKLRQSPAVFRQALRKPRLVMVGEGKGDEEVWWDSN